MFKKKINLIFVYILMLIFIVLIKPVNASEDETLKNTTRAYFCSKITNSGDCILLENYDSNGNKVFGLIDTGNAIIDEDGNDTQAARKYLKNHNVSNLEFIIITHQHKDHTGNLIDIIDYIYEEAGGTIGAIYMKEADSKWCSDNMNNDIYYESIEKSIKYNIKIIGTSYTSLKSSIISPRMYKEDDGSANFVDYSKTADGANKNNFEGFNRTNRVVQFGSAKITIFNWQIFDENQNTISIDDDTGKIVKEMKNSDTKRTYDLTEENYNREISSGENNNSLGILLTQENKKAFFGGDLNNRIDTEIGDEDRIKNAIGDVDFMKANHHGNPDSNTEDFLNTLRPEYMVITNSIGKGTKGLKDYIKDNNVKYLYSTADSLGVSVTLTTTEVYLGFEKPAEIKNIDYQNYYFPPNYKPYDNFEKWMYEIVYNEVSADISNWTQLKNTIDNNKTEISNLIKGGNTINENKKNIVLTKLKLNLVKGNSDNWTINRIKDGQEYKNQNINIGENQIVSINSTQEIKILRGEEFTKSFFYVYGQLSIGEHIILDGNKKNVISNAAIINVSAGTLNLYGIIQNNYNSNNTILVKSHNCICNGSGIYCLNAGTVNIYNGAKVINNTQKVASRFDICPENYETYKKYKKAFEFSTYGAGICLKNGSYLKMEGGEISGNVAINESIVTCTNIEYKKSIRQDCYGAGIYAYSNCEVDLKGGKVTNNSIKNNAKVKIFSPDKENSSSINGYACLIYGTGIATEDSVLNISDGCEISANNSEFNNKIILEDENNSKILFKVMPRVASRGGQIFCQNSDIIIDDAIIKNGNKTTKSKENYAEKIRDDIRYDDWGGAICITKNSKFDFNKLSITNCATNYRGGAIFFGTCNGLIKNSTFSNNNADEGAALFNSSGTITIKNTTINRNVANDYGGGLYNAKSTILIDSEIIENQTKNRSGGGIFIEEGKVIIDGSNSKIKSNIAEKSGGGICNGKSGICVVTNGQIQENTATTGEGGGIYNKEGKLYKKDLVNISSNKAPNGKQSGKNVYPTDNSMVDNQKPKINDIYIPTQYIKKRTDVTINVSDDIGVKTLKVNGKELTGEETYTYIASKNGVYTLKVTDYFGNETSQTFEVSQIVKPGDANSDDAIDIKDIFDMNKHRLKKKNLTERGLVAADLNDDGQIDINDILKLNKYRLGKIKSL